MISIHVFSLRRLATTARTSAVARAFPSLLAVAALCFPVFRSASAQDVLGQDYTPGSFDRGFNVTQPLATVYATLSYSYAPGAGGGVNTTVFFGGDLGYEAITQPNGVLKGNFVLPTFGNTSRLIFTAVPETVSLNGADPSTRKILVGGFFGRPTGNLPALNITRIALSGAVDSSFVVGVGANNYVTSILPLADGTTVVGGLFTSFNTLPRLRIVKLRDNGAIDPGFSASSLIDNDVLALAEGIQPYATTTDADGKIIPAPDGNILVAGTFNHVGGLPITKLARLKSDGTVDTTFHPVIDTRVNAIAVLPTGKIIIGGEFTNINGVPVSRIARLNYDGSLDTSFGASVFGLPTGEPNPVAVYAFRQLKPTLLSDGTLAAGKIYVGGNFTQINGVTRRYLGVINPNGTLGAFDPKVTIYDKVQSIFVRPDGRVLVGETLGPKVGSAFQPSLIRLIGATSTD